MYDGADADVSSIGLSSGAVNLTSTCAVHQPLQLAKMQDLEQKLQPYIFAPELSPLACSYSSIKDMQ